MKIAGSASTDDDTHGGGEIPPCTRLTPDALPEVQKPVWADNSYTGDTSDFVPKQNHHWFVFRVLYGHTQDVIEAFKHAEILHYTPSVYQKVEISGKKMLRKEPLLPGLVFAYMTRNKTHEFVKQPAKTASYLKYYTDKTKPVEADTQLNPPVIIPDDKMSSFIKIVETKNEHIMTVSKERCHFKSGDFFQVVCGQFKGITGQVVRAAGQQRIAVELNGIGYVLTAYIPSDFMEKIDDGKRDENKR